MNIIGSCVSLLSKVQQLQFKKSLIYCHGTEHSYKGPVNVAHR